MLLRIPPVPPTIPAHHQDDAPAVVVIAVPGKGDKTQEVLCTVVRRASADDRPYRVIVRLWNGKEIGPCAPECVIPRTNRTSKK